MNKLIKLAREVVLTLELIIDDLPIDESGVTARRYHADDGICDIIQLAVKHVTGQRGSAYTAYSFKQDTGLIHQWSLWEHYSHDMSYPVPFDDSLHDAVVVDAVIQHAEEDEGVSFWSRDAFCWAWDKGMMWDDSLDYGVKRLDLARYTVAYLRQWIKDHED